MNANQPSSSEAVDKTFMQHAIELAQEAGAAGEVPVGSVIVLDGQIVSTARNQKESLQDPTAHAEILAVRIAAKHLSTWRLSGCTLYTTLEPCPMCAGALIHSRIDRLVVGALDPKTGATGSLYSLHQDSRLNHSIALTTGVCEEECSQLLKSFFKDRRNRGNS